MLKIVYPVCCGIDVHKKFIVATIASTNDCGITSYKTKRFSTFTKSLREFADWLRIYSCFHVCMESTGKYWIPVYNILENNFAVTLAHPKYVRAIRGKKTDKKDSVWIADLHKHGLVLASFIPPRSIRQLRDLLRYRYKLVCMKSSEKNRFHNSLTVSNIMLDNVVSDSFGKSASAIIKHLLDNPLDTDFDPVPLLHRSMLKKQDDIRLSIDGVVSDEQAEKISICLQHHDHIESCIARIDAYVENISSIFSKEIGLISSVPGIRTFSATVIISEIGVDMSVFHSAKHLCSWAGLTPQNNESAGKKKSVRVSRAGVYLKPLLVQCANAAIKDKNCSRFRNRYESIKRRRGHKRAIIAIARMLLSVIYHIIVKSVPFDSSIYEKPSSNYSPQSVALSVEQAIKFLTDSGFSVLPKSPAMAA